MILRLLALIFAGALCVFYFTAEWAEIREYGQPVRAVTAYDFFLMGIARSDAAGNINGGASFVWVILPLLATVIAILTILSSVTSRLFVMLGSFGTMAAIGYVVFLGVMSGGTITDGAVMTAVAAAGLLFTGLASRTLPMRGTVKGTPTTQADRNAAKPTTASLKS